MSFSLTTHWDLVSPDVLRLLINKVGDLGRHVTGRNSVGAGKLHPLNGKGFACSKMILVSKHYLKRTES
jgi:hypothetical protein